MVSGCCLNGRLLLLEAYSFTVLMLTIKMIFQIVKPLIFGPIYVAFINILPDIKIEIVQVGRIISQFQPGDFSITVRIHFGG